MADVARQAGVSMMTVSRVVNGKEGTSDATRQHVQEIIDQLGYRPSGIARSLATKSTGTIGLVVPDNANPFFSEVARGVEQVAYEEGYSVFLCNTDEDPQRERNILDSLEENRVDGIVLCSSRLDDEALAVALARFPAVLVNRQVNTPDICTVLVDDVAGARLATRHLLDAGHRQIGMLAGPETSFSSHQRIHGFFSTLESAGLPADSSQIVHCPPTVEGGLEIAVSLLSAQPDLNALFCYNDLVAVGALQACAQFGRRVPDDIVIVGYDDIPLAALVTPALTTCHIPRHQLGKEAMRLLLDHIQNHAEVCDRIVVQPTLVIRDSAP